MTKRTAKATLARRLANVTRRVQTLERARIGLRSDENKLQVEVYDLTSRVDALERKAQRLVKR